MKRMWFALLVMMFLASYAVAQSIYVFPADGFRYQQEEGEIVLTRTNLEQYSDLITQLGTTTDAVRASFDASRIAMEVIMPDGGQIAISTSPADADSDAVEMADLDETQKEALRQRFSDSGLYQDCVFSKNASDWIRMTSSAMYGSMPVWQLRYVTLHSGGYLILNSTIIGREPAGADDDAIEGMISRIKLLTPITQAQNSASPVPTAEPTPEPERRENEAMLVITEPAEAAFTGSRVVIRGKTEPNSTVFVTSDTMHTSVRSNKNGAFSVPLTIEEAGSVTFRLRVNPKDKEETIREITLTRVLTEREQLAAFKATQAQISYDELLGNAAAYIGTKFIFRGKVMDFTDLDGNPCALVCVSNPQTGTWKDPIYAMLSVEDAVNTGDVLTFYLIGTGITLPAPGTYTASGLETEVPVADVFYFTENR